MSRGIGFSPFFLPLFYELKSSGFRGCGFNILRGVSCLADVDVSNVFRLDFVSGDKQLNLPWMESAVKFLLSRVGLSGVEGILDYNFEANFSLDIGTGSATLLSSLVALCSALDLSISPLEVGDISHMVELDFDVGFGISLAQLVGGVVLVKEADAPSLVVYSSFDFKRDLRVMVGGSKSFSFPKYESTDLRGFDLGDLGHFRSFDDLVEEAKRFSVFFASRSRTLYKILSGISRFNPVSVGFGFLGTSFYALVFKEDLIDLAEYLTDFFPFDYIFVSEIDPVGVRKYF